MPEILEQFEFPTLCSTIAGACEAVESLRTAGLIAGFPGRTGVVACTFQPTLGDSFVELELRPATAADAEPLRILEPRDTIAGFSPGLRLEMEP